MASLTSPFSCTNLSLQTPLTKQRSFSLSPPKASLSLPQTLHPPPLLQRVTRLCERRDLAGAAALLRDDGLAGPASVAKDAIGILLQACGREKDIEIGRRVHAMVWSSAELGGDLVLNTRLITMYSLCGSPADSRLVFEGLERTNLFAWNAVVSAYSRNDLHHDAIRTFVALISETDFRPDFFTLPCVLRACSGILDAGLGKAVHGFAVKMGLARDAFVGNALVGMYGKCELLDDASKVFDTMPDRNLVSWNSMLRGFGEIGLAARSYGVLREVLRAGLSPDDATVVTVLPVCAAEENLEMGTAIHGLAVKLGLHEAAAVSNALTDMYLKCGRVSDGRVLFAGNGNKNVVSWNSMLGGFSRSGDAPATFDLLRRMQSEDENVGVNEVTVLNVLPACSSENELMGLKEIHGYSLRRGFHDDELVANAFVSAYAKCGALRLARGIFHGIETKTVNSWNALIGGLAQNGDPGSALDFYFGMRDLGLEPDSFTVGSVILAYAGLKLLRPGKEIHGFVVRRGLESDPFIAVSLMSLYIQCGAVRLAQELFDGIGGKSLVSWNAMLTGYLTLGLPGEALSLFREMVSNRVRPGGTAVTGACEACSQLSALRLGTELHCFALKAGLADDPFVACSITDMYAKTGSIGEAQTVFRDLKEKDLASWNVIIAGHGLNGQGLEALERFEEMRRLGLKPDRYTFIGVLMACSHAGLVAEGLSHFNAMRSSYGVEPKLEHYTCVVDMLGRAGRLQEALNLVNQMPEQPDGGIWSSLLSSCLSNGDFEMGREISRRLIETEPEKAENYVLVSNFYAGSGKWDDVKRVRQKMKETGLQKDPGVSQIELDGKVFSFVAGDNSSPEFRDIKEMWEEVEERISKIGYKPNLSCVLHEVEEEEKIEKLRGHSEKLTISLGLLKTRNGSTVRVRKNLRICLDCHNAAKLISKAFGREIIVRDNKRFHHFRDGICSCSDYW